MRTSFHHQHPNFQLATSWHADYPIFRERSGHATRPRRGTPTPQGNRFRLNCEPAWVAGSQL
jgi:hypothetical protein